MKLKHLFLLPLAFFAYRVLPEGSVHFVVILAFPPYSPVKNNLARYENLTLGTRRGARPHYDKHSSVARKNLERDATQWTHQG